MTSSEEKARPIPPPALREYQRRTERHSLIQDDCLLSENDDLLVGSPFCGGSIVRDIQGYCDLWHLTHPTYKASERGIAAIETMRVLRDACTLDVVKLAENALKDIGDEDGVVRMWIYRSCMGDAEARPLVVAYIAANADMTDGGYEDAWRDAVAFGLTFRECGTMSAYCSWGVNAMHVDEQRFDDVSRAGVQIREQQEAEAHAKAAAERAIGDAKSAELLAHVRGVDPTDQDFLRAVLEDRAEFWRPRKPELVVVPLLPEGQTGARKELYKSWRGIDSVPLPIVLRGDVGAHRRSLVERWPQAEPVIDVILGDLAAREEVHFRPTLLVGSPGSGKSSLTRAICDQLGLPCELVSLAGVHDAALMGTSAQWYSARESMPLQLIKRTKFASVAIIWDEAEKAATSRHNGSPLDALLPMLEIDQAKRYRDLALEVEVDLSMVSHFATANSLDGVPAPLRDRMRILEMPEPTWQHIGALSKQIVERLAAERGIDARWFEPLAEDEIELVKQAWPGGSIRQLTRIVTTILDGRSSIMGRA